MTMLKRNGKLSSGRVLVMALALLAVGLVVTFRDMHKSVGAGYEYQRGLGDTINVAIAYSPMSLYRYADTLGGFNYDMLSEMGRMYGDKFKFYPVASVSESLDKLSRGVYDILVADIPVTASLRERFLFTTPVYTDRMVLVSRDTTDITPLELAGDSVWAVAGAPSVERLENLSREIGDKINICDGHDYTAEQLVMLVAAGDIPRAVVNKGVAERLLPEYPDVKMSTHVSFSQFQSWILNRESVTLADTIDRQIERFKSTPEYETLLTKWGV